jgi:hypothetical protein
MRKSLVRFSLTAATLGAIFAQASAGVSSVNFWFNPVGDPVSSMPSNINVQSGSDATFSVYVHTEGVGALSSVSVLFGYSTATSMGPSATPADTKADFVSFTWGNSSLTSGQLFGAPAGGGGVASGSSRPYGLSAQAGSFSTFTGSGDGIDYHLFDVTLHINAAGGDSIPINIWTVQNVDAFTSNVSNAAGNTFYPSNPYTATLNVQAVPEPASLAIIGMGALALIRRRRASK